MFGAWDAAFLGTVSRSARQVALLAMAAHLQHLFVVRVTALLAKWLPLQWLASNTASLLGIGCCSSGRPSAITGESSAVPGSSGADLLLLQHVFAAQVEA
jgi:hypothetical protein